MLNNIPHCAYVNNFCIVWSDVAGTLRGIFHKQVFTEFLAISPNCFVAVTVAVHKHVNSSIYIFGIYDFLCFTLDLYILGTLKHLLLFVSIENINTTISLFLWIPFLILFLSICKTYTWFKIEICSCRLGSSFFEFLFLH